MKTTTYNPEKCFYWKNQKSMKTSTGKNPITKNCLIFALASLICLAGVVYVFQINKMATMGYEIKEKENAIRELQEKSKQLEIEAAQLRSIYISQIKEQQEKNILEEEEERKVENKENESDKNKEEIKDSILASMRKPAKVSFLEVEIEKVMAMK